jgi:hypothetical protein
MLLRAGDLAAARTRYDESLAIAQRLAVVNPTSAQALRDLIITHVKLGTADLDAHWFEALRLYDQMAAKGLLTSTDREGMELVRQRVAVLKQ